MAYTFTYGNAKRSGVGTSPQTAYGPVAVGKTVSVLSFFVANKLGTDVKVTVTLVNGALSYQRAYAMLLPANSMFVPFADGFKIDLVEGDYLQVASDTAASLDTVVSYAERVLA